MLGIPECDFCGRRASEVEVLVNFANGAICNECVSHLARKMGLISPTMDATTETIEVDDPLPVTFIHSIVMMGHVDQPYDMFLVSCLLDRLRSKFWDVSFEVARVTRTDRFVRSEVAEGCSRYQLEILVRSCAQGRETALRATLEEEWASLTMANMALLNDKGTRDLLDPRLRSLAAYVIERAGKLHG